MKEMIKLGVILLLFSAISAGFLAVTNDLTAPAIAESRRAQDLENMQQVFEEADDFVALGEDKFLELKNLNPELSEIYIAKKGESEVGYVAKVTPSGFGGTLEVIVGFLKDGSILGLRVGKHSETPGLGDNATQPDFYEQFSGLSLKKTIGVNKMQPGDNEILAISAATITSEAVVSGVNGLQALLGGLNK